MTTVRTSKLSSELTADLLADLETEAVAETATQMVAESKPGRRRARPAATTETKTTTSSPATSSGPLTPPVSTITHSGRPGGSGPAIGAAFYLSPADWRRPGLSRGENGIVITFGPVRLHGHR